MRDLLKIADVLDAAAEHIDAIETEKVSSAKTARQSVIDDLAAKYASATGEEMPSSIREKLANSDQDIVSLVRSLTEKNAGTVEPLGGGSDRDDDKVPSTVKEASEAADDRFLNWVNS